MRMCMCVWVHVDRGACAMLAITTMLCYVMLGYVVLGDAWYPSYGIYSITNYYYVCI